MAAIQEPITASAATPEDATTSSDTGTPEISDTAQEDRVIQNLQGILLLKCAHFLNTFKSSFAEVKKDTDDFIGKVLAEMKKLGEFWHGVFLMEYCMHTAAMSTLSTDVLYILSEAKACTEMTAVSLIKTRADKKEMALELYDLYCDRLCSCLTECLEVWRSTMKYFEITKDALCLNEEVIIHKWVRSMHDRLKGEWIVHYDILEQSAFKFLGEFQEQVKLQLQQDVLNYGKV